MTGEIGALTTSAFERTREELNELLHLVDVAERQEPGFLGAFTGAVLIVNQALKLARTYRRELRGGRPG